MSKVWETKEMVEICDLITCGVAKKPEYVDDGIPFLSAKNIKKGQVIWNNHKYISEKMHSELTKNNKPLKGDILYTRVGSFGEAAVVEEDVEFSVFVSLTLIKPKPTYVDKYFLKYFLNSDDVKKIAKNSISGSGVGNLNVGTVRKFRIPLPPLPQQKQIVAILDKAFAAIDTAKANAEQNLQNAKELFESYLQNVFENNGDDWEEKRFDDLTLDLLQGINTATDKTKFSLTGVPILQAKEIGNKELNLAKCKFISQVDFSNVKLRYKPNLGDILLNNIGYSLGRCIEVDWDFDFTIAWNVMRVVPNKEFVISTYLNYGIQSPNFQKSIWGKTKGADMPFISKKNISTLTISFPKSKEKQKQIVQKLDTLSAQTKKLEAIYTQKTTDLEEMKKSVLQKAFSGQLNTIN